MLKRVLKLLHVLSAAGVLGALSTHLILLLTAGNSSPIAYAAVRAGIAAVSKWLLLPSLALVLITGLLAIAAHRPFIDARWVWVKALLGLSMFEGTLVAVQANARRGAELSAAALTGPGDPMAMQELLRQEWGGLWIILTIAVANVVLGVWRPRLRRQAPPQHSRGDYTY